MQVPIDRNFENKIKLLLEDFKKDRDTELEFRFGKFIKGFHAGVNKTLFYNIHDKLIKDPNFIYSHSKFKVDIFSNKFRKLTYVDGSEKYLKKYKLQNIDIDYSEYVCRLSLSKEYNVNTIPEYERLVESFQKERYTFVYKVDEAFKIDLTVIDGKFYDIELEFLDRSLTYDNLVFYFSGILNLVMTTKYILPYLERLSVISNFNKLQNKYDIKYPYVRFNKPINLPIGEIQNLKNNYVISPKMDGVRYFLYIKSGNIYLINHKVILKLAINFDQTFDETILDVEKISDDFYILDLLFIQGGKYLQQHYLERLEKSKEILSNLKEVANFSLIQTEQNLEEGYKKFKEFKNTDGVIFTPISAPYYNNITYKYKPVQTIDFYVKKIKDHTYEIYSIGEEKRLVSFTGTPQFPTSNFITLNSSEEEILEGGDKIVEFYYQDGFHPMRIRDDKETPNYIEVAKNIWNDIKNPILESQIFNLEINKMEYIHLNKFTIVFKIDNPTFENRVKIADWIKRTFPNYYVGSFYPFDDSLPEYYETDIKIKPRKFPLGFEVSDPKDIIKEVLTLLNSKKEDEEELFSKVTAYQTGEQKDKVLKLFQSEESSEKKESEEEKIKPKAEEIRRYPSLDYLSAGERELFLSPLDTKDYRLIRFYAVPDGSCFFHAVSSAIDDEYKALTSSSKKSVYIQDVRAKLQSFVQDINNYSKINNGDLYIFKVSNALIPTMQKYQSINPSTESVRLFKKEVYSKKTFNSLKNLDFNNAELSLPTKIGDIRDVMVDGVFSLEKYRNKVIDLLIQTITKSDNKVNKDELRDLITKIFMNVEDTVVNRYSEQLGNLGCFFENQFLSVLSDFFNVDIYIIRAKDEYRMPVRGICDIIKGRTSVVLLQIEDSHYELIGGYNPKTKKADIAFEPNHPFIQKLKKITCDDLNTLKDSEFHIFYRFYKM